MAHKKPEPKNPVPTKPDELTPAEAKSALIYMRHAIAEAQQCLQLANRLSEIAKYTEE